MTIPKQYITIGGWTLLGVLITVMWMGTCNHNQELKLRKELYNVKISAKEDEVKSIRADREQDRKTIDSLNAIIDSKDEQVQKEIRTIIKEYHEVPVFINSLNDDSLRAAAERWK